ncbi:hypothetical protein HQ585_14275 [candidate division KSB1 bacterium]|nr:hypothetical protein [candidate division KSB1 bacterium]
MESTKPIKTIVCIPNLLIFIFLSIFIFSCDSPTENDPPKEVPHEERWGIYVLNLATEGVELITSSSSPFSFFRLSNKGEHFIFSRKFDSLNNENEEICIMDSEGNNFQRLTDNEYLDVYPAFSSQDTCIVFLSSWQETLNLDLYKMDVDGSNQRLFYDSGSHDADVHWMGDRITFTANSRIWTINSNGSDPVAVTDPPNAGEWGEAPYPYGDYDPRLSPVGSRIAFSRMVDASNPHGGYDIFLVSLDGTGVMNLTNSGYTQGVANWSHQGDRIVYQVSAIGTQGKYDIYMINSDGSNIQNITPDYFPNDFLCHSPAFSMDDTKIYFVGEWWE